MCLNILCGNNTVHMVPHRYLKYIVVVFLLPFFQKSGLAKSFVNDSVIAIKADSSFQIISSYNNEQKYVAIKFFLKDFSAVGLELYDQTGRMVKLWTPRLSDAGEYLSKLPVEDLPNGTYLLNVLINDETFQQAVFKY